MQPISMTRAEYQTKYGTPPPSPATVPPTSAPIKMTRAEYQQKYGQPPQASPTQTTNIPEPNYLQDIGGALGSRASDIGGAVSDTLSGKINPLSGLVQTLGGVAGGVNDIVGKTLEHLPIVGDVVKGAEGLIGQGVNALSKTDVGKSVVKGVTDFSKAHPELSSDIGAVGNILGTAGLVTGAGEAKNLLGKIGKDALAGTIADITPQATAKATAANVAKRGTVKSLIGGTIEAAPDPVLKEVAQTIHDVVPNFSKLKTFSDKVNALQDGVSETAKTLRSNLSTEVIPFVTQDDWNQFLGGIKSGIAQNPLLVGDAEKTANRILDQFQRFLPKTGDITPTNILDARQELDKWITKMKGSNVFDPKTDNAISTALRVVRQGANNLLESKAPEAGVKALLRKQTLLYDAIENMAPKTVNEIGTTRAGRFVGRHPIMAGLIKTAGKRAVQGAEIGAGYNLYKGITGQ